MLPASMLLPDAVCLHVQSIDVDAAAHRLTFDVATIAASACCPTCTQATTRVHSHYQRCPRSIDSGAILVL